jgi:hypothetical protein
VTAIELYTYSFNKFKIENWKKRSRNRTGWEKSIREVKVCIGLWSHLRGRRSDRNDFIISSDVALIIL